MTGPSAWARRIARARSAIGERDLDGLLVAYPPNVCYLTGFTGSNGSLLLGPHDGVLGTDGRYQQQAGEEMPADTGLELLVRREKLRRALVERARGMAELSRVGFEADHVSYAGWQELAEHAPELEWVPTVGLVEGLRAVKEPAELEIVERAVEAALTVLEETLELVAPGTTEWEIAAELEYRMRASGAQGPAFETIVASGPRSARPHARTGQRALQAGDLLLCDLGVRLDGYCSDITRTFVLGEPTARQLEVYETVHAALGAGAETLRAGSTGREVDEAARAVFRDRGLEERFLHSTGHGLGLEVHESPRLSTSGDEPLEPGMVVTVEPGLYFPDWGGIRIEEDFVVTSGRPRRLGRAAHERIRTLST